MLQDGLHTAHNKSFPVVKLKMNNLSNIKKQDKKQRSLRNKAKPNQNSSTSFT